MKFVIVGTGGTGGIIGAYLAQAGNDVTFIARGRHLEAMRQKGLIVRTSHRGDIHIQPVKACTMEEYQDTPDVMLVCVKFYGIPDAIKFARRTAGPDTLIVPILNVFGTGEVMQEELPGLTALDGCVYIFGMIAEPGIVAQPAPILRLFFGFREGQDRHLESLAQELEQVLNAAEIEGHFTEDIRRDALQKFSFVSPLGAAGVYYDAVCGDFMHPGEQREMFKGLVREIENLGHAMGLTFAADLVESNLKLLDSFTEDLKTSMQRDVAGDGPSEFSGLVHRVVELGQRYQVPVPLYTRISLWGKEKGIR